MKHSTEQIEYNNKANNVEELSKIDQKTRKFQKVSLHDTTLNRKKMTLRIRLNKSNIKTMQEQSERNGSAKYINRQ